MQHENTAANTLQGQAMQNGAGRTAPWWRTAMPLLWLTATACGTQSAYVQDEAREDVCLTVRWDPATDCYVLNSSSCKDAALEISSGEELWAFTPTPAGERSAWQKIESLNSEIPACSGMSPPAP